jgi:ATP-binding protein involved in chromosome partitioning
LAIAIAQMGYKVALLDADVYGPSAPKMMGAEDAGPVMEKIDGRDFIIPPERYGVKVQSIGFYYNPDEAVVWRGPMASNVLKQIINQTQWGELDFLLIDLPPGTGDIHLTMVQEMPITGAVIVSTPQQVALVDVVKGIQMFQTEKIAVPILGLVENMAWFTPAELPNNKYYIFGKEGCAKLAKEKGIELLGQIPIVQSICESGDSGKPVATNPFTIEGKAFAEVAEKLIDAVNRRNSELPPTQKVQVTHK